MTLTRFAGFIYDPSTNTFTDATPPGSTRPLVQGMNAAGRIVGDARLTGLGRHAFVWQQGPLQRGKQAFESFLERFTLSGSSAAARGINDAGVIVGFLPVANAVGFVGNASRGYQFLFPPGAMESGAQTVCEGINNRNQVVCAVTDADGVTTHAFIGTPRDDEDDEDQR